MRIFNQTIGLIILSGLLFSGCNNTTNKGQHTQQTEMEKKVQAYKEVALTSDLSTLSDQQKQMLSLLFDAADIMDDLFWQEAYGDKNALLASLDDSLTREYVKINYGPWDRLHNNEPFIKGVGPKPAGANFYPADITKEEFKAFESTDKTSQYTLIRRNSSGDLESIPYHLAFAEKIQKAAGLLKQAAALAEDPGFKKYLELRANALLTDEYFESDMAWMDMKNNSIDFVVGPIENYEDGLFGYKAAHEAFILIKDKDWSNRLLKYAAMLPELQRGLPVPDKYKAEKPGTNSDLGAYDAVYYAGDCNAGSKTIAINLPNDEKVQLEKGSRRLQLKNAMKAKFDNIMVPIANTLISEDQRKNVVFDAFFENTMFHEVAHGLGIKNTITTGEPVRKALKDKYSALEEGKADILGLYMVTKLNEKGELKDDLMNNYVTFLAGIFRSIRFGASSAHGTANLIRFNYFKEKGAFTKNQDGTYSVNFEKMQDAMNSLSALILKLQGDGDYAGVQKLVEEKGVIGSELKADLEKLNNQDIPVDIVFKQGKQILGIQ
ncbi:MAG TPA: Zn-dependent hydrolase [Bacteroidales bacterium]|nr:Zn-dependent hydrolase [Bacteroidales bacterium]